MILIDFNGVLISGILGILGSDTKLKMNEATVRGLAWNILRHNHRTFAGEYGEMVICCDARKYWRKEVFPYYKANRKKMRESSTQDLMLLFELLGPIREEMKQYAPYKMIEVDGAEADDIVGVLGPRHASEGVLIVATDGDFLQLQKYPGIKQYSPTKKKFIKSATAAHDLKEKIIRGDKGDGIPNILSPGDSFVNGIRQKVLTESRFTTLLNTHPDEYDDVSKYGFTRNQMLIDLSYIPKELAGKIITAYDETHPAPKNKLLSYFIEKRLTTMIDVIGDF